MRGEWRTVKIAEIAERVGMGPFGSSIKVETFVPEGIPVISGQHLHGFRLDDTPGYNFIAPEHAERLRNANVQRGDVVFTHAGNIGQVAYIPNTSAFDRYVISQRQFYLRPDQSKVLPEFLVAYFRSPEGQHKLLANTSQVGVPSIAQPVTYLRSLEIPLPPLPEQRAIAHILGTLDDKIELNRRMSETLEAIARALFESWFIDFDPVRRNMARERGQNQPSPPSPLPVGEGKRLHYRGGYDFAGLVETARELRKKQTSAEAIFWELVRDRRFLNLKFRRQHQIGDYIADFYCHECRLVIEFDGGVHSEKKPKDHKRDAWMAAHGFKVLRFKNEQLLDDPDSVLTTISRAVESPPSPPGRRAGDEGVIEGAAFDHLFPDRLVPSELGEIPQGWRVGRFGDVVELLRQAENPLESPSDVFWHFSIPAYDEGQWPKQEVGESIKSQKWRVPPGAVLLSKLNPEIERVWLVDVQPGERAVCSTEFLVLASRPPFGRTYVYYLVRSRGFRQGLEGLVTGTSKSHQRAQVNAILGLRAIQPPEPLLRQFDAVAGPLLGRTLQCRRASRTLAALRDALLPKLVRGEIRVKDAERFLKERGL